MQINNLGDLEMLLCVDLIEMGRVVSEGWGRSWKMSPLTGRGIGKEAGREPSAFNQAGKTVLTAHDPCHDYRLRLLLALDSQNCCLGGLCQNCFTVPCNCLFYGYDSKTNFRCEVNDDLQALLRAYALYQELRQTKKK